MSTVLLWKQWRAAVYKLITTTSRHMSLTSLVPKLILSMSMGFELTLTFIKLATEIDEIQTLIFW